MDKNQIESSESYRGTILVFDDEVQFSVPKLKR